MSIELVITHYDVMNVVLVYIEGFGSVAMEICQS
jgi:hypothetical protein